VTPETHDQAARHDPVYDRLNAMPEFTELRHRYRKFVIPASAAFLSWYALYVMASMFAPDFMGIKIVGNINMALVVGLLQFITTFLLAFFYSGYSNRNLDPLARELTDRFEADRHQKES
jgi:uncharacterized membrane protein (DUF485 family)